MRLRGRLFKFCAKGRRLSKTVAFLAETPGSVTIEEQQSCVGPDDIEVVAGRKTFNQLGALLVRHGIRLTAGDRVKVYDLSCLTLTTPMLIRVLTKMLSAGISFEICSPPLVIDPTADSKVRAMLDALDQHYRRVHGVKTHPVAMAQQGRKRLLGPDRLPEIREALSRPGATATDVAQDLGVARSTLFNYLERYDLDRRGVRAKKSVDRNLENGGDDGQLVCRDADVTPC